MAVSVLNGTGEADVAVVGLDDIVTVLVVLDNSSPIVDDMVRLVHEN